MIQDSKLGAHRGSAAKLSIKGNQLTSQWVKIISRFHWIFGGGDPVARQTALTLLPCISVTMFGDTTTFGTTGRYNQM